jgi:hypothetical protein
MPLELKYFVLKPKSKYAGDRHAAASRAAMRSYAYSIRDEDSELAKSLEEWADEETRKDATNKLEA